MASSRTINAPGVELREIDRSRYGIQDNSLPNAPIVLITGFAEKGENYYPQWINEKQMFFQKFGYPSTEEEKYFFNACMEVLDRGGICLACRLPYDNNESRDNGQFTYCDYKLIDDDSSTNNYVEVSKLDSNITSFLEISSIGINKRTISLEELDDLRTGMKSQLQNIIRIVDISKSRYDVADFSCVSSNGIETNDALGIFPVIVTPMNAIYFQGLFNNLSTDITNEIVASCYNEINYLSIESDRSLSIEAEMTQLPYNQVVSCSYVGLSAGLWDNAYTQETISKIAADQFPLISFKDPEHLDSTYLKQIGVVVFKAFADPANNNKVNFQMLESFIGSLDKKAKSSVDNSSIFIDNIVNSNSKHINLFSNIDSNLLEKNKTLHMSNQVAKMLGFFQADCKKNIFVNGDGKFGQNDITDSLSKILDICKDPNQLPIDIVVDAGVSNIAQFWNDYRQEYEKATFPIGSVNTDGEILGLWTIPKVRGNELKRKTSKWQQVIKKFDDFCHYTRKDCMFIADCLRPFCLEGNLQKVRKTKPGSSVEKDIVPYINSIAGINSSYSAGYCNWFQVADAYSGDYFWCPPSIKAASIYIYCDTYFHSWDAPAGMTRGIVPGAINVAFNPNKDDAGKIYQQTWNYAISYPMDGIIMEGQKTFQYDKTALDRINVRRLLLKLEKQVTRAAKYFLYEQNTEYQRQKFVDTIRPFFEDAVNGSGLKEYAIKCDDELNTPEVIDNNEMHCKIAVKPIKTIEFIVISLVATSQSASVTEEVMR